MDALHNERLVRRLANEARRARRWARQAKRSFLFVEAALERDRARRLVDAARQVRRAGSAQQ